LTQFNQNNLDMLAFTAEVRGQPSSFGLFLYAEGKISRIALLGDVIQAAMGASITSLPRFPGGRADNKIELNDSGTAVFHARLCCGPYDRGLLSTSPFQLEIPNGGFEAGGSQGRPAGWSTSWSNTGLGEAVRLVSGDSYSFKGESLLRLHVAAGGGAQFILSDPITVAPDSTYVLTSQMRYNLESATDAVYFSVIEYDGLGRETKVDEVRGTKGENLWRWKPKKLMVRTSGSAASIRIRFGLITAGESYLDADVVR
jgi:hypothetical protein